MDTMKKADGLQWDGRSEVHAEKPVQVFIIRGKLRNRWIDLNFGPGDCGETNDAVKGNPGALVVDRLLRLTAFASKELLAETAGGAKQHLWFLG
ncbi:hypothetical protein F9C07_2281604 [Aspergillus flavus]|uniref:Uncharacterized protein n=1 Tax=Aspergillus flavus (strain ATCC 200026 / FGSC A1120 / IAM 13836 / NRRL 3357 / JCM 12722 / SRRC 167) TaxID=332952 RepID=A0A7U2MKL5_ASPFN|nr:hypothetical protein F9C07_2281604 [Aspergillus flavus]